MERLFGWFSRAFGSKDDDTYDLDHSARGKVSKLPGLDQRAKDLTERYLHPRAPLDGGY
ncbi:MAG: hypothetical protein V4437_01845 [Patescibacteria group bacterium]